MKLIHQIQLRHKLLGGFLLIYTFFAVISYTAYQNLGFHVRNATLLQENIRTQNGILKIKEYFLADIDAISNISKCKSEQDLDNLWVEHNAIISNIDVLLDSLYLLNSKQINDIIDVQKLMQASVVEKQKVLYKEKIRQLIQSSNDTLSINSNYVLAQEIIGNIVYIREKKLTKLETDIKTDLDVTIAGTIEYANNNKALFFFLISLGSLLLAGLIYIIIKLTYKSLTSLKEYIDAIAHGNLSFEYSTAQTDEVGRMGSNLHDYISKLKDLSNNLDAIGEANFDNSYTLISENDELGNSFLKMKESLQLANEEAKKLKAQEDLQNWATIGIAKFGEILRQQTNNNTELSYNIIKALIEYLNANQGGIFIVNDDNREQNLELMATYAYGRKKFKQKQVRFGEGLVGTCALEAQTIYMTNIPEDYIEIESYLGHSNPRALLIVPLKLKDKLFGIIEIASFNEFKEYEIKFIEDLAETIASTLSTAKINAKTAELLEISKQQSEAMLAQEEEMRQNLEELQSTQEEAARREKLLEQELANAKTEISKLKNEINELKR